MPWSSSLRFPVLGFWLLVASLLLLAGLAASHFLGSSVASDTPQTHWRLAGEAIAAREYPEAIAHLSECLNSWPLNAEVHFLLARTCRRAGKSDLAQAYLARASVLKWPEDQIQLERDLRKAQRGDVWNVEDSLLEKLNQQPPEEVIILEALVQGLMKIDRLEDVLALTTPWIDRYPEDWLPLIYRGNALLRLFGWTPQVEKDFERLLELKPNHPDAHIAVAIILTNRGLFAEAVPHYQAAIDNHPEDVNGALFGLANCQYSLGHTQAAQETLGELFARCPQHPPGFFLQAKIELAHEQPREALKWLQQAETFAPKEADLTNALVQVYRQLGMTKEADEHQRLLDEIRERDAELSNLANALKTQPNNMRLRYQTAMTCLKYGRDAEAAHWFRGILFKEPNHQPTLKALADYFQSHGDLKMADHYRRKIHQPDTRPKGEPEASATGAAPSPIRGGGAGRGVTCSPGGISPAEIPTLKNQIPDSSLVGIWNLVLGIWFFTAGSLPGSSKNQIPKERLAGIDSWNLVLGIWFFRAGGRG